MCEKKKKKREAAKLPNFETWFKPNKACFFPFSFSTFTKYGVGPFRRLEKQPWKKAGNSIFPSGYAYIQTNARTNRLRQINPLFLTCWQITKKIYYGILLPSELKKQIDRKSTKRLKSRFEKGVLKIANVDFECGNSLRQREAPFTNSIQRINACVSLLYNIRVDLYARMEKLSPTMRGKKAVSFYRRLIMGWNGRTDRPTDWTALSQLTLFPNKYTWFLSGKTCASEGAFDATDEKDFFWTKPGPDSLWVRSDACSKPRV